ncbi:MAG: ribonuclease H-like domain-containing protein [Candidatus Marinimicrobia bacterium]|nr:ribonuclease H-like domain-containing protein [Candidatus Neomarinimicrobiota bacterium]
MRSIKDRLNTLYRQSETEAEKPTELEKSAIRRNLERMFDQKDKIFAKTEIEKKEMQPLEGLVPGQWINTTFGDIFRAEFTYNLDELYGNLDMRQIFEISASSIAENFKLEDMHKMESILFIDTETTGLAGGSGTVAFMIGLGWVEDNSFVVHQYFISQLNHEEGMLEYIARFAENFTCLASFNGKSYDVPLLNSRYIMNRLVPVFEDFDHIDLLHPSRALWKYSLRDCKLKTLEAELMGLYRDGDIPGELIPQVYFEYLESGLVDRIEQVFFHNRFDIVTMLGVLLLIMQSVQTVVPDRDPLKDYAKGRIFQKKKDIERSIQHFKNVLHSNITISRRIVTLLELAALYKKEKMFDKAVELWRQTIEIDYSYSALVELAIYYEHFEKNGDKALEMAQKAQAGLGGYKYKEQAEIEKRINRLKRKVAKTK